MPRQADRVSLLACICLQQVFPDSAPGTYYNRSTLGLVSAQLSGRYSVGGARINLEFTDLAVAIGPLTLVRKVGLLSGLVCCAASCGTACRMQLSAQL